MEIFVAGICSIVALITEVISLCYAHNLKPVKKQDEEIHNTIEQDIHRERQDTKKPATTILLPMKQISSCTWIALVVIAMIVGIVNFTILRGSDDIVIQIKYIMLAILLSGVGVIDYYTKRIPNPSVIIVMVMGIGLLIAGRLVSPAHFNGTLVGSLVGLL